MSNVAARLWHWILKRSPQNASNPNPTPIPQPPNAGTPGGGTAPIDISADEEVIWGVDLPFGEQDSAGKGPLGELIKSRKSFSAIGACGHVMSINTREEQPKQHIRTIAGICYYCKNELSELLSKGLISPIDAQRLSLVCNECARTTVSGKLSCPRHYMAVKDGVGGELYLGPEEQEQQKREATVSKILLPLISLISDKEQK